MTINNKIGSGAVKALSFLALVAVLAVGSVFYLLLSGKPDGAPVDLVIERGKSAAAVAEILAAQGIIQQPGLFKLILRVTEADKKLRAGEFHFRKEMRAIDALNTLYHGEPVLHAVTIPEGWRMSQIAAALHANKLIDENRFLTLATSPQTCAKYGFKTPTLEGFLFPTTYQFSRIDGEERILDQMVSQFKRIYEKSYKKECDRRGLTLERFVTMASIIEKETGVANERPLVSSVFYNRLKKKMRLQSDPTTIYGISNFNGNLTKDDLHRYSPYNTYVIFDLPPGPIASPGEGSLKAALDPATTDYLFFVANTDSSGHIFSKTYGQHSRNVTNTQVAPLRKKHKAKKRR
ncbi:MAG: endolytic transglycosylase MltG [Deltaproteobacteria bacterium]|nr:endolytic transglycosylase MltG [Deltaproteobacteria bacterium]